MAAIASEISEDEVRNELVPLSEAIAVALPDGEEADAMAVTMPDDARIIDAPALMSKDNILSKFPDNGAVKSSVVPSMSEPLNEPDADPVPVIAGVKSRTPASINSTVAMAVPLLVRVNILSEVTCDSAVTEAAYAGFPTETPQIRTTCTP